MGEQVFSKNVVDSLNIIVNNSGASVYNQVASKVIANTTTETSGFNNAGAIGTLTIPADFLKIGRSVDIHLCGLLGTTGTPAATLKIKIGSVVLISSTGTLPANLTNAYFDVYFTLSCRTAGSSGTVMGQGRTLISPGLAGSAASRQLTMTAVATVDTTVANAIDVTYTWGTASASNTVTITNAQILAYN